MGGKSAVTGVESSHAVAPASFGRQVSRNSAHVKASLRLLTLDAFARSASRFAHRLFCDGM
jgi:hypothetical protein